MVYILNSYLPLGPGLIIHLPGNIEDMGLIPGMSGYIEALRTVFYYSPLSLVPVPGCRLKNTKDAGKW